ncbi:MAG: hypothetical protein OXU20_21970 [Myxococcales bacterium]|nr:hypothetical protein [Myxococcales bacterium]
MPTRDPTKSILGVVSFAMILGAALLNGCQNADHAPAEAASPQSGTAGADPGPTTGDAASPPNSEVQLDATHGADGEPRLATGLDDQEEPDASDPPEADAPAANDRDTIAEPGGAPIADPDPAPMDAIAPVPDSDASGPDSAGADDGSRGDIPGQPSLGCEQPRVATALYPGGQVVDPQPANAPSSCGMHTQVRAPSNATLQVTKEGTVIFAPAGTGVARSEDHGASWQTPIADAPPEGGQLEWAHPWITRDPDTNKLFYTTYHSLVGTCGDGTGHHYWTSTDDGQTWRQHPGGVGCDSWDWGKITVGPPATQESREALARAGYPNLVYFCAGGGLWAVGPQHYCFRSTDGGETFTRTQGSPTDAWEPESDLTGFPNAGAIGPDGTFYKVFGSFEGVTVAISDDEGDSWRHLRVPDSELAQVPGINWLASNVATDSDGNVYVAWVDDRDLLPYVVISTDRAQTWSERIMVAPPGVRTATNINLAAFEPGFIAINYYGSPDAGWHKGDGYLVNDGRRYHGYVVTSTDLFADRPMLWSTTANDPAEPTLLGISVANSEYLGPPVLAPDGSIWAGFLHETGGLAARVAPLPQSPGDRNGPRGNADGVPVRLPELDRQPRARRTPSRRE